jgi:hypothetical protein
MPTAPTSNILYLVILPIIYIDRISQLPLFARIGTTVTTTPVAGGYGTGAFGTGPYGVAEPAQAEQIMTVFPNKEFATRFFPDEVEKYVQAFAKVASSSLTGGHVKGYEYFTEPMPDGRVIIGVVQNVE